jgi:multiple sugar transport system ATP-binding protein
MTKIHLKDISKKYPGSESYSVQHFHLAIEENEFIVFVGPSGCGKSTTLRMIAGLEDITEGDLYINGKKVNEVEPKHRDIAMVFQNYALYPHMNVYDNLAFGLKVQKTPKQEIRKKVEEAALILGLTDLLKRKPKELSGGQRQRVALGRAIVRNSSIFLMDEPLSNLDAKLRVQMRTEIIKLHRQLGTTTIYVTHDQTEAMTMASRIVVMKDGRIQQIGSPTEVYRKPENLFVASFIGSPGMNFLQGTIQDRTFHHEASDWKYELSEEQLGRLADPAMSVTLGIRPEYLSISKEPTTMNGKVDLIEVNGAEMLVHVKNKEATLLSKCKTDDALQVGDPVYLNVEDESVHLFDQQTEKRL